MSTNVFEKIAGTIVNAEETKQAQALSSGNTHTGDTNGTAIKTVTFAPGELEAGDILRVGMLIESDAANSSTKAIFINSWAAANSPLYITDTNLQMFTEVFICFINNTTCRSFRNSNSVGAGVNTNAATEITGLDLSGTGLTVNFGCKLVTTTDTITLDGYFVSVIKART